MGSVYPGIDDKIQRWLGEQRLFFVATAPSSDDGMINLSPKGGMEMFKVLGPREVAYVDLIGSGIETVAHLKDNARIVLMFCAFEGPPKILRLHGTGKVVEQQDDDFDSLSREFFIAEDVVPAVRSIIVIDVSRVSDSCGFVVPRMTFEQERDQLYKFAKTEVKKHGPNALRNYADVNNRESIDGLPALSAFSSESSADVLDTHSHQGRKL